MNDNFILSFVVLVLLIYGLYMLVWPEKARKLFLSQYDLTSSIKWYKPNTWLREKPFVFFFRWRGFS